MRTFRTIKLQNPVEKARYASTVWTILSAAYRDVEGGLLYDDVTQLIRETSLWELAEKEGTVYAVVVYKRKYGRKLVAMGIHPTQDAETGKNALAFLVSNALERAWMELSEAAEHFVMKRCGGAIPEQENRGNR